MAAIEQGDLELVKAVVDALADQYGEGDVLISYVSKFPDSQGRTALVTAIKSAEKAIEKKGSFDDQDASLAIMNYIIKVRDTGKP